LSLAALIGPTNDAQFRIVSGGRQSRSPGADGFRRAHNRRVSKSGKNRLEERFALKSTVESETFAFPVIQALSGNFAR
jgi:hypothetical protein